MLNAQGTKEGTVRDGFYWSITHTSSTSTPCIYFSARHIPADFSCSYVEEVLKQWRESEYATLKQATSIRIILNWKQLKINRCWHKKPSQSFPCLVKSSNLWEMRLPKTSLGRGFLHGHKEDRKTTHICLNKHYHKLLLISHLFF